MRHAFLIPVSLLLAACAVSDTSTYSPPEESGLMAVGAFPAPDDVCQVIGENDATREFLDDSATLVGCPVEELGAIADREAEGGVVVGQQGQWVLISVPNA